MLQQAVEEVLLLGHEAEEPGLDRPEAQALLGLGAALLGGELEGEDAGEEVAGVAGLERHAARRRALWQEIRPHSAPSTRIDTDIDAIVPMLRMYSTCTGETLRRIDWLRSRGSAPSTRPRAGSGPDRTPASGMIRRRLRR